MTDQSERMPKASCSLKPLALALGASLLFALSAEAQIRPKRPGPVIDAGRGVQVTPQAPASPRCVIDPSQIASQSKATVSQVSFTVKAPAPPPKPTGTKGPRVPDPAQVVQPASLGADLTTQLCESLKTGTVTTDEVTGVLKTMEKEHARKSHKKRKTIKKYGVSYTYEYTLNVDDLKFYQKPGVGYCSDFDWRYKVRNISQRDFTVFSTTGEVGVCLSPGFGLFYIPGLASIMPFPIPGLCFDDAAITKLDLRNVNDTFEDGLVQLVDLAFAQLHKYDAKVCIMGSPYPPWFTPVVIPPKQMVAYCTSTRNCEIDTAQLLAAAKGGS
jgi:hypothetical protein